MTEAPELHPMCRPLAFLLGTWRGRGEGTYPTIEPFTFEEEVVFGHRGTPVLGYTQRTVDAETGEPRHAETGYWRPVAHRDDRTLVEVVLAHPTGVSETAEGVVEGTHLELRTATVVCTPTAKEVAAIERVVDVEGDVLRYELAMAAVGVPLTPHLRGELHRVPEAG